MGDSIRKQLNELERLEQAAENSEQPEKIQREAANPQPQTSPRSSKLWFVPHLVVAGLLGGCIFLLDWQESLLTSSAAEKVQRYLIGALGITLVLAVGKAIEVY